MGTKRLKLERVVTGESRVNWVMDLPVRIDVGVDVLPRRSSTTQLHWRLSDPVFNEIYVDIDGETGTLKSLSVLFLKKSIIYPLSTTAEAGPRRNATGVPSLVLDAQAEDLNKALKEEGMYFQEVKGRCRFEIGDGQFRVILFRDDVSYYVTTADGKLKCEFNELEELCAFTIEGLTALETDSLKGARFIGTDFL